MRNNIQPGIGVVLYINDSPVGGQLGATLNQSAQQINITNKIKDEWEENLSGTKSWNISCNGMYVVDSAALEEIENAFINNVEIKARISIGRTQYEGQCLIVDFPLTAIFNSEFKYSLKLLGTGPLIRFQK